ncbi:hypothetical protein LZ32DRAFT_623063 [Colletotrichum eremochloae]|nr:hypothetical protein LZ32DRAFT_623063 [Colletotrichum eremochloae]
MPPPFSKVCLLQYLDIPSTAFSPANIEAFLARWPDAHFIETILSRAAKCETSHEETESPEASQIDAVSSTRPDRSINHSAWGNFVKDPIPLSIETKRHDGDMTKSWRNLREPASGTCGHEIESLPGITVLGHEWFLVASVPCNITKTILYTKQLIRTAEPELGTCSILAALECLHTWIVGVYWPAFKVHILGLE